MQHKDPQLMEKIRLYAMNYYREHNQMPSIRTIADGTGMNRGSVQKYLVEMQERGIIEYDGKIRHIHASKAPTESKDTYNAGIIGSISCGLPADVEEYVEDYVPLPVSIFGRGELYILRASGDSMIDAGISDGDLVVVRTGTTLKRLRHDMDSGRVILHPENPSMQDMLFDSIAVQGVAVKVIKNL